MTGNNNSPELETNVEVEDEEGFVDRARKQNILENRQKVEETAEYVFPRVNTGAMHEDAAVRHFHPVVRNYLVSIEPLLKDFDLPHAKEAYLHEPMGVVRSDPPPQLQTTSGPPTEHELKERGFRILSEPPESVEITITGLKEVIEREEYTHTWEVDVEPLRGLMAKRKSRDTVVETKVKRTPKRALLNAVRTADEWLQHAGIGLEIGGEGLDNDSLAPDY